MEKDINSYFELTSQMYRDALEDTKQRAIDNPLVPVNDHNIQLIATLQGNILMTLGAIYDLLNIFTQSVVLKEEKEEEE